MKIDGSPVGDVFEPLRDAAWLAEILSISPRQVRKLADAGVIPCVKVGKLYRFETRAIREWVGRSSHGKH